jgi:hypothetical protein
MDILFQVNLSKNSNFSYVETKKVCLITAVLKVCVNDLVSFCRDVTGTLGYCMSHGRDKDLKLSLCLTKYSAMKTYWGVEV